MTPDPAVREIYFYLSHARASTSTPDLWVQTFYGHLVEEVRRLAGADAPMDIGYADFQLIGEEREALVAEAINAARVFVALYSPEYLPLPSREQVTFEQRLKLAAAERAAQHFQLVLWAPITSNRQAADLGPALELGADFPEYIELGLRTMCQLAAHATHYAEIVRRLAARIVEVAENAVLRPTTARSLMELSRPAPRDTPFVIAVIAPVESRLPAVRREHQYYGARAVLWRPFRNRYEIPIADHTAKIARSMMLPSTSIVDFAAGDTSLETCPGVILIDPWVLEQPDGLQLLRAAFAALRRQWITVMVVVDRLDPQYDDRGRELAYQAMAMSGHAQGLKLARDADEFDAVMSRAVNRSRQRFILAQDGFVATQHPQPPKGEEDR